MRLINTETFEIMECFNDIPPYAILSHTWGEGEVTFGNWKMRDEAKTIKGYRKIELACRQAAGDGFGYVWVDTNCIDKTSSSELSEAINSMFAWYRDAEVCYVFLEDVIVPEEIRFQPPSAILTNPEVKSAFAASKWFRRGWTLQELLAPSEVVFFSYEWIKIATKEKEKLLISNITGIDSDYIRQPKQIHNASIARRMSWMANRKTTRVEDIAYCLLGIFGIQMALLYGEGHKAFLRLQEEIIRVSNDQTIFCWQAKRDTQLFEDADLYGSSRRGHRQDELEQWTSILAPHPCVFRDSALYWQDLGDSDRSRESVHTDTIGPYSITNFGLSISVPLLYTAMGAFAVLDIHCRHVRDGPVSRVLIALHRVSSGHYIRLLTDLMVTTVPAELVEKRQQIFVDCRNASPRGADPLLTMRLSASLLNLDNVNKHPIILLTSNKPMNLDGLALTSMGMELIPLYSAIEANDDAPGFRGAAILTGKITKSTSFQLFVGGRSTSPSGTEVGSTFSRRSIADMQSGMDWNIDVCDSPPPGQECWNEDSLKPLIDQLSTDFFGSWCKSEALKNVLSWPYSPKGALICYFELDELQSRTPDASPQMAALPNGKDSGCFSHLRRSNSDMTSLQRLYQAIHAEGRDGDVLKHGRERLPVALRTQSMPVTGSAMRNAKYIK